MKRLILALLLVNIAVPAAQAQYPPGYRPPGYGGAPPYGNPYYPQGSPGYNRLNGQADVMRAQGDLTNANEQARIAREKANQAKLDTKRQAFDQMNYEKANTPTYVETLSKDKAQFLTRIMNFPTPAEVSLGKSLNTMLPFLQSLASEGSQGPPVAIPSFAVKELNLTSAGAVKGSVSMLSNGGTLEWPVALRGKEQKKLDKLIPAAVEATIDGSLTTKMLREIRTDMKSMREDIRKQLQKEEIEGTAYMRAVDYYDSLEAAINALERPDAKKQLAGGFVPKASNVQELVEFITDKGLTFAPATLGKENAYQAVHEACVRYARTAQSSAGFTSLNAPAAVRSKFK